MVYFSRAALSEWVIDAGVEVPIFLSVGTAGRQAEGDDERREFQTKELNSISLIINGLISLIKEVDKAHCDQSAESSVGLGRTWQRHLAIASSYAASPAAT